MRVIVCGSRHFADFSTILAYLISLYDELAAEENPEDITIVHGAARGADALAAKAAERCNYDVEAHPAEAHGAWPACGPKRNAHMLSRGADLVLAFCIEGVGSKGTADMVSRAVRAGVRTRIITVERKREVTP